MNVKYVYILKINEWLKINPIYPIKYEYFKLIIQDQIQEKY